MHRGSTPEVTLEHRSQRGKNIGSLSQQWRNSHMSTDVATLPSVLMKTCLQRGKGQPLGRLGNRNGLQEKKTGIIMLNDSSQLPSPLMKENPSKLEVSSAALETSQIKDKLKKRRMSEGILESKKGSADSSGPEELSLRQSISRSVSQRPLITSNPLPPIQSIPTSSEVTDETEHGVLENGMETGGDHLESKADPHQNLFHDSRTIRKFFGAALIPAIHRSKLVSNAEENSLSVPGSCPLNSSEDTIPVASSQTNLPGAPAGLALKKRVNKPFLPSIPVINHDSSFLRHASAHSLPANLNSPEREEDTVNREVLEVSPLSDPEQGLVDALRWLNSNDWELKEKGLFIIRCLASCHSEVLLCRLHDVSLAATKEVSNLRSKVSRFAIGTLTELFKTMKKHMDQEVEEIARVLLQKTGDSSEFIQKAAEQSLGVLAQSVSPSRVLAALMASGVNHRNPLVRKCAAEHLLAVMERIGAKKLLSGSRESVEMLVQTLVKLAQDCNQDTRFYGRKMLDVLMAHSKFNEYLKQCPPSHDLRDVLATIKQKRTEDQSSQAPSAKSQRGSESSSLTISLHNMSSDDGSVSSTLAPPQPMIRRSSLCSVEVMEKLKELNKMLVAKEFQIRMKGITLLMEHCKNNPQLVLSNIIQIFDAFIPRLQDPNKKVNQAALESIASMIPVLKDGLSPVVVSVVIVVTDNLNSKNSGIYSAAVKVLDQMIISLDKVLLLQTLANRVRFVSGQALQDITDRLSVLVALVYPQKHQIVERHVLPVLWYFLSNMIGSGVLSGRSGNVKTVVAKLTKSLHEQMGHRLEEYASSQSQHVLKNFQDLLNMELR